MRADRTAYFREYARKNREKRKAISAAYRARNKAKIAAYAREYRAEHGSATRGPRPARVKPAKPLAMPIAKAEALESLKERFAAFRAARQAVE